MRDQLTPTVATVHDLSVFDVPWAFSRWRAQNERLLVHQAVRRADLLIVMSDFTAARVHARFGREAAVVPLAPAPDMRPAAAGQIAAARDQYGLPERFVLQVGTIEPRKDVAALQRLSQRRSPIGAGCEERVALGLAASKRAAGFSWPATAAGTVAVYRKILPGLSSRQLA